MPVLELTDEQLEALKNVINGYFGTEYETIRKSFNEGMTPDEVRFRCEQWNRLVQISNEFGWSNIEFSEEEIADFEESLKDYAL